MNPPALAGDIACRLPRVAGFKRKAIIGGELVGALFQTCALARTLGLKSVGAELVHLLAQENLEDFIHSDVAFFGRTLCGKRLLSINRPVSSFRLSAISASAPENPRVKSVIA